MPSGTDKTTRYRTHRRTGGWRVSTSLGALAAAALALLLRAPFLVVVLAGAGAAAGLRLLGWG